MTDTNIVLPSKPKIVEETSSKGTYEIEGLYPGYGHTLGNSLRRIILSSLTGAAITRVKIAGVPHEFSAIDGVKEDVINIILNLKKARFALTTDEAQVVTIKVRGENTVTAGDIKLSGQVTLSNPELHILTITNKDTEVDIELTIEQGIGYVRKEEIEKERVDIGAIALDAAFSPIISANYDVEEMRIGDRTDFNKLTLMIQTDGTITPHEALEKSIEIMINQLRAVIGFKEDKIEVAAHNKEKEVAEESSKVATIEDKEALDDALKTRIESIDLSQRTTNALVNANIRTIGGLIRKKEKDILDIEGLGNKGLEEIKTLLQSLDLSLKE
ncbi:MAG: DNA-directed RNA polymerase subunit alpha [bacterium]